MPPRTHGASTERQVRTMRGSIQAWPTRPNMAASENPLRPARTDTKSGGHERDPRLDPGSRGPVGPEQVLRRARARHLITAQDRLAQPIGDVFGICPTMDAMIDASPSKPRLAAADSGSARLAPTITASHGLLVIAHRWEDSGGCRGRSSAGSRTARCRCS